MDLENIYQELLPLSRHEKFDKASIYFRRSIDMLALNLKHRNNVLAEHLVNAFIGKVIRLGCGPDNEQTILICRVTDHLFDENTELYCFLEDEKREYEEELDHFLEKKMEYINNDLIMLAIIIIASKEEANFNDKEKQFLQSL